jgi:site-specific recombinase XerD
MDIPAAIDEYLSAKQHSITSSTYDWYMRYLGFFEKFCQRNKIKDTADITFKHVQQFVSESPSQNSYTLHARAQIVKGFLSWCAKDEDFGVKERTVRRIEMPKIVQSDIEIFTDDDISKLLRACDRTLQPHRNRAIIHMLLDTGVRASELCFDADRAADEETGLKMGHVILGRGEHAESYIWVMGKGRKPRTIGLGKETVLMMTRYLNRERGHPDCEYVFVSRDADPLSVRMLQQFLQELGELAGVPNVHPHRFRHTFAVTQLMNGTSDLVLMRLMGHTTLDATKIYTRAMSHLQARRSAFVLKSVYA